MIEVIRYYTWIFNKNTQLCGAESTSNSKKCSITWYPMYIHEKYTWKNWLVVNTIEQDSYNYILCPRNHYWVSPWDADRYTETIKFYRISDNALQNRINFPQLHLPVSSTQKYIDVNFLYQIDSFDLNWKPLSVIISVGNPSRLNICFKTDVILVLLTEEV